MVLLSRDGYRLLVTGWLLCQLLLCGFEAGAQILRGPWVDEAEKSIETHRKSEVVVVVLDPQDRAILKAQVQLHQRRHAFVLGLSIPAHDEPPVGVGDEPLYRCFNAIALDRLTVWNAAPQRWSDDQTRQIDRWAQALEPIERSFGPVVSGDPAHNYDGLTQLPPAEALAAVRQRISSAFLLDNHALQYDIFADAVTAGSLEETIGAGVIHRMFEQARAINPDARLHLRFRDGLDVQRSRELARRAQALELRQVPFDGITIDQQFTGQVQPLALSRTLADRIGALPVPVTLAGLEISGTSEMGAAINLESVMRLLFAQPNIQAVYFRGLLADEMIEPQAALMNEHGELTPSGQLLDDLFRKHWWSDISGVTDDRGNLRARVFKGWYDITVTLADGTTLQSEAYINEPDGQTRYIVMQQTTAD